MKSNIFIISGPSGAGEDSVMEGLKKYLPIERIINTTCRAMRPEESQGRPYYFISREEFENKIKENKFVEYAKQYNGNFYGATEDELERVKKSGKIGIWKMEYQGVMSAKKNFPKIISILLTVSDLKILENRIRRRHNVTEEYIKERIEYTREWMEHADIYDYVVYNEEGKLDETIKKVAEIIKDNLNENEESNQENSK